MDVLKICIKMSMQRAQQSTNGAIYCVMRA